MKRSKIALFSLLFFVAASLTTPATSRAGTFANDNDKTRNTNTQTHPFNAPNLNKEDGFDESEHKLKIQQILSEKEKSARVKPIYKHNL